MDLLFYYIPALQTVRDFLELGGIVLIAIGVLLLIMWALIFERFVYLRTRHQSNLRAALQIWETRPERRSWYAAQTRQRLVSMVSRGLGRNIDMIQTCVALCPLLGLLGTVYGMIQVFEVMAISGSGNPRSMASGVSQATVPTMAGMVGALSGVAISSFFQNKARQERQLLAEHMTMDH